MIFSYFLQSTSHPPGVLSLSSFDNRTTSWSKLWSVEGDQGASWQEAKVIIPPFTSVLMLEASYIDGTDVVALGSIRTRSEAARGGFARLAWGFRRTCAVYIGTGQLHCWGPIGAALGQGRDDIEIFGRAAEKAALPAVDLGRGAFAQHVTGGIEHVCALLDSGFVKCWGQNAHGILGLGLDPKASIGDSAGSMGDNLPAVNLGENRKVRQISARHLHTCALLDDDSIKCWGKGAFGQLGNGRTDDVGEDLSEMGDALPSIDFGPTRTPLQVEVGENFTCARFHDASVSCWGQGSAGLLGYENTIDVGRNSGEMGNALPPIDLGTNARVKQIAVGLRHSCALLDDNTMKCWGRNYEGELGLGRHMKYIKQYIIGDEPGEMGDALPAVDFGKDRWVRQISLGETHTCALLDDYSIKCFGKNTYGQLGQGHSRSLGGEELDMGDNLPAVDLGVGHKALQVSAGQVHTCAVLDVDAIVCWGFNEGGQLGVGQSQPIGNDPGEMGGNLIAVSAVQHYIPEYTPVRLGGGSALSGRVEVLHRGLWGTVCDDGWSDAEARVVCAQLGLAGGLAIPLFGGGSGSILMDEVQCTSTERTLGHCSSMGWSRHNCNHEEDAGVQCHLDAWASESMPDRPPEREEHSAVLAEQNGSMIVFAGQASLFQLFADLWLYNLRDKLWVQLSSMHGPVARAGHSAVWHAALESLLVFGGRSRDILYDDLWAFSLPSNSWQLLPSDIAPAARASHSAVWDGD